MSNRSRQIPIELYPQVTLARLRHKPRNRCYIYHNGNESVLFDPGGIPGQEEELERIRHQVPLENIRYVVIHQSTPEVAGVLPVWEKHLGGGTLTIITHGNAGDKLRQAGVRSEIYPIEKRNFQLSRPGLHLTFIPTPYCHWPHSFVTYIPQQQVLFSGELFGSLSSAELFFREEHFESIADYHAETFSNKQLLGLALHRLSSLDIKALFPRCGPAIIEGDIPEFTRGMEAMNVLLDKKNIQIALETYGEVVDRKHLEAAMEKSVELEREVIHQAQLLDIVTNSVEDLICYKDLQLRYIGCNLAFSHFVGREQDEIIGKTDEDIFPESYARFFRQFEENVFQQNQSSVSLAWSWKQDKPETMRRFISNTSLLRGSTGSIFGLVTVSRDWTRQWQAEQKLANLNRHLEDRVQEEVAKNQKQNAMILQQSRHAIMGEMLSMIAHQWRQPLSAISMAIGTVDTYRQMGILGDEDISVAVKDIEQQTDYLSRVIEDFRNFFRPASTRETTSLAALVQRCLTLMAHLFERNNIILENHTALQDTVQVHTNEIIQVIMNILKNAFDVLQERNTAKGKVVLQDRAEGEYLYLQIKDNAGGIAPEHQGHIFDPYFSTKDSKNGTGLGLYMSKVIMEEHNHGTIRFWNGEEGAVFELQFHRGRCE